MGSQNNRYQNEIDQIDSKPPQGPRRCENGCGFYGSESTMNLCSKCYREFCSQSNFVKLTVDECPDQPNLMKEEPGLYRLDHDDSLASWSSTSKQTPSLNSSSYSTSSIPRVNTNISSTTRNRCSSCRKRVGLLGFDCRCGNTFCSLHRYPEEHSCTIDFKTAGHDAIAKANPLIKADKLQRI